MLGLEEWGRRGRGRRYVGSRCRKGAGWTSCLYPTGGQDAGELCNSAMHSPSDFVTQSALSRPIKYLDFCLAMPGLISAAPQIYISAPRSLDGRRCRDEGPWRSAKYAR